MTDLEISRLGSRGKKLSCWTGICGRAPVVGLGRDYIVGVNVVFINEIYFFITILITVDGCDRKITRGEGGMACVRHHAVDYPSRITSGSI